MLSGKAQMVLRRLIDGMGPAEILERHPALKPEYLADVAQEVADLLGQDIAVPPTGGVKRPPAKPKKPDTDKPVVTFAEIRLKYPRAYMAWDADEDANLQRLFKSGTTVGKIADQFQRKPGAIESRLQKLGLIS